MAEKLIEVYDLKFGPLDRFHIPQLEVHRGEKVLLMGPSGCGKTSLLECLIGLRPSQARQMQLAQRPSVVFQDLNLIEEFSVTEVLALELKKDEVPQAIAWLKKLDVADKDHVLISQLSHGEKQRVAVVRALAKSRKLLFADEPTSHLDREHADQLIELLIRNSETALVVSHDIGLKRFFHRVQSFEELLR